MSHVPLKPMSGPELPHRDDKQLRRDRVLALVIVIGMLVFLTMVVWLASLNGSAPIEDYWLMP